MRRFIPNLLTLLNLLSGSVAVVLAVLASMMDNASFINIAIAAIALGAIFDVFDGFTARKLGVASPLGVQLDSLADLVTFGLAPSTLYLHLQMAHVSYDYYEPKGWAVLIFVPLLLVLFSAYRLAKFNIDTEQKHYFKGLATPASALFTLGLVLAIENGTASPWVSAMVWTPYAIPLIVILQGLLLVSNIPMFSLKVKPFTLHNLVPHLLWLVITVLCMIFFRWEGLAYGMIAYLLLSLLFKKRIVTACSEH
ncbi:MAG: CDP-alcohol phosphatidyltransferase family protein [Bacteroides sp.]